MNGPDLGVGYLNADGRLLLTGESVPVELGPGDRVAGATVIRRRR
ncbi:hypothetical protein ACFW1M_44025 [Streptomyces inhibens]